MIQVNDKTRCSGCHACYNVCPKNCIRMLSDNYGFFYPSVDMKMCINCHLCEKSCPIINSIKKNGGTKETFAAINKNDHIRLMSSSGGIFSLLAEYIISHNGIVYGAAFTDNFKKVHHIAIEKKEDLYKLRGSKYVQSEIGHCFTNVKHHLDIGQKVLFTGTPCQIAGLYAYLKKDYDNLFTQDLICHGSPSPKIWRIYIEEREKDFISKANDVSFRNKIYGWKNFSLSIRFENNIEYMQTLNNDPFLKAFLTDTCLRDSCYKCSFKKINNKISDITLADFWGIQEIMPEMDDDKGTSAVLIHTEKGRFLFNSILSQIKLQKVDLESIIKYNPALVQSAYPNPNREKFICSVNNDNFDKMVLKYCYPNLHTRIKNKIKDAIKKMLGW